MKNLNMGNITQKWVDIMKVFSNNYFLRLGASEISRRSKVPQQTVSRVMKQLLDIKVVDYELVGKNKLFYFDFKKSISKNLIEIIENYKNIDFKLREKIISLVIEDILKNCDALILFGSYSSQKNKKDSDIDIFIVNSKDTKKIKQKINNFNLEINEHFISYAEFTKLLKQKSPLLIEVANNHVIFGNTSKIVELLVKNG